MKQFKVFKETVDATLKNYAPLKKSSVRANQTPFIKKGINKEIIKSLCQRSKFENPQSEIDRKAYTKQRNLCVRSIMQEKEQLKHYAT